MPLKMLFVLALILASSLVVSQPQPNVPANPSTQQNPLAGLTSVDQLDAALAKDRLDKCQAKLKEWDDWWAANKNAR